jgi:glycosyltransferase involved in cell wall biosynthesis
MNESRETLVSVVIPAYNSATTIAKTIEACLAQDFPKDKYEIIIADDGSTDNTREIAEKYPVVLYLYQDNKGPAAARNLGWRSSKGQIVFFTDSDCVPEKGWISKILEIYTSEGIGGVGGSYYILNSDSLLACCIHEEIIERHSRSPREVNYLGGFNVSYRRHVLEELAGFDESYSDASGEDNDMAYKVIRNGYKLIFDKDIYVGHHHPDKLFGYLKNQAKHGFWRMKLYQDHPNMVMGDVYAGIVDLVRPLLAMLTLILVPVIFFRPVLYAILCLVTCYVILQLFRPLSIVKRTKRIRYLYLAFITLLRGYSRGFGMIAGVFRFYIFNRLKSKAKDV